MINNDIPLIFEACVESLEEAISAEKRGANRIELCSDLAQDGLTPSKDLTMSCLEHLSIPIMAMVRPRGGNFVYSEAEIRQMESEIEFFKQVGVSGVVFGLLTTENQIDIVNTTMLAKLAMPLQITFHKAIDYSSDVYKSFQTLNSISGLTRILTSGGMETAWDGRHALKSMVDFPERQIKIIAAGKVLPGNRYRIAEFTGVSELHGKRIV
ncbi:MAG: copper homeostasis protein CutC [Prolixibacteraceae bacterium]|jgi:copper homeostasis protein